MKQAARPHEGCKELRRGLNRRAFWHRQLTVDQVLREWDSSAA
jgi:hypothetical protein